MIELTNAVEKHKGNPIFINANHIAAVYEYAKEEGGSLITVIYGGPTGICWEVEEGLHDVIRKINDANKNH